MTDEQMDAVAKAANRTALSKSVGVVVTGHTGNPIAGRVAGEVTSAAYEAIAGEVKAGAGVAALGVVGCASKAYVLGTAGSVAFAGATIAAAPAIIFGGAVFGGVFWVWNQLTKD